MTSRGGGDKQAIRIRVWDLLEREQVVEPGVDGHIPAFTGAGAAAARLAELPAWRAARVIKAVPDVAQQSVRERALRDGKRSDVRVGRACPRRGWAALPGTLPDWRISVRLVSIGIRTPRCRWPLRAGLR